MKERLTIFLFLSMVMFVGVADAQQVEFSGGGAVRAGIPATLGSCSSTHTLTASNDMLVCGKLEVDGITYFDSYVLGPSYRGWPSGASSTYISMSASLEDEAAKITVNGDGTSNNTIAVVPHAYISSDYAVETNATNPTLRVYSATNPTSYTNQWLSLTHDQTDGVISTGTGSVKVGGATGTTLVNGLAVSQEAVACTAGNECTIGTNVITTLLTAGTNAADDAVAIADGVDGQRRTFVLVDGTDDIVITPSTGTATTLEDAGDAVTYEYDATTDTWWRISGCGI